MYKLILCLRYLRTRYIALICIVSVTLGVATMIVVNGVMAGFTHEMQARLNGMLGDLIFESRSLDGALDAEAHMAKIQAAAGDWIVGMSPTVHVPALMYIDLGGQFHTRQITLVGIDEQSYAEVSQFGTFLQHPDNRQRLSFELRDGGYDVYDHQAEPSSNPKPRTAMQNAGWSYRRYKTMLRNQRDAERRRLEALRLATEQPAAVSPARESPDAAPAGAVADPFAQARAARTDVEQGTDFDASQEQHTGLVVGIGLCGFRGADGSDQFVALPGDDVRVSFPKASLPPDVISEFYTVVDFYESKMNEYDSNFAFVPLRKLQESRGMVDPETGVGKFTSIQIKLRPEADPEQVRDTLRNLFPAQLYMVSTWRDKQGPLLAAVQMETLILNLLLFLIIAVAGFGIMAIFFLIVVEKTRDIGILKSLGASPWGVLGIFLSYGISLGVVGSGAGLLMGLAIVSHINQIADALGRLTGTPVFDPSVYYFYKIPTLVEPLTVALVVLGAVAIAVLASVAPAVRAASLHPVQALRFE
jgi:lipoprotein-releasing system permease protein